MPGDRGNLALAWLPVMETSRRTRRGPRSRGGTLVAASIALGAAAGLLFAIFGGGAGASQVAPSVQAVLDATHLPPLLRLPGEAVALRYDVHCAPQGELEPGPCDAVGRVFVRSGMQGSYRELPLRVDDSVAEGRYVANVPLDLARAPEGFTYYAELSSRSAGSSLTLPAGGVRAPQHSALLRNPVEVRLGAHRFGDVRRADARVFEAKWGNGPAEVGLESGRNLPPIGASSFDVDSAHNVYVLDQAHRRVLRSAIGRTRHAIPVAVDGTIADLAVAPNGTMYVLESSRAGAPLLRSFGPAGDSRAATAVAERTASQVRLGTQGPVVLQHPSGQWMPVASGRGPMSQAGQVLEGDPGRELPDGREVVILRWNGEIRAEVREANRTRRSWRVTSATPLAEVQLAEPLGSRLVLVVRVYSDVSDEYIALVLGPSGLERTLSLDSAGWAETAPLSRFRLVGSSLYQLGSTPTGAFVDRYDLGGTR